MAPIMAAARAARSGCGYRTRSAADRWTKSGSRRLRPEMMAGFQGGQSARWGLWPTLFGGWLDAARRDLRFLAEPLELGKLLLGWPDHHLRSHADDSLLHRQGNLHLLALCAGNHQPHAGRRCNRAEY